MSSWTFGSDHVPLLSWVMAVGSSRSSSRVKDSLHKTHPPLWGFSQAAPPPELEELRALWETWK